MFKHTKEFASEKSVSRVCIPVMMFVVGLVSSFDAFGIYYSNPEINRLIAEKQAKMAQLETCAKKVKGFKIAGISTIGLTTVGVGANIVMASKESQLSDELERARGKLNEKKWNEQQQALEEARRNQNAPGGDGDVHIRLGGNNSSSSDGSVTVTIPVVSGNSGDGNVGGSKKPADNGTKTVEQNDDRSKGVQQDVEQNNGKESPVNNDAKTPVQKDDQSKGVQQDVEQNNGKEKPADNGTKTVEQNDDRSKGVQQDVEQNNGKEKPADNGTKTVEQNDGEQQITSPKNEGGNKSETNQVESSDNKTPTNGDTGQTQSGVIRMTPIKIEPLPMPSSELSDADINRLKRDVDVEPEAGIIDPFTGKMVSLDVKGKYGNGNSASGQKGAGADDDQSATKNKTSKRKTDKGKKQDEDKEQNQNAVMSDLSQIKVINVVGAPFYGAKTAPADAQSGKKQVTAPAEVSKEEKDLSKGGPVHETTHSSSSFVEGYDQKSVVDMKSWSTVSGKAQQAAEWNVCKGVFGIPEVRECSGNRCVSVVTLKNCVKWGGVDLQFTQCMLIDKDPYWYRGNYSGKTALSLADFDDNCNFK